MKFSPRPVKDTRLLRLTNRWRSKKRGRRGGENE